jgi:DNA-binding CsgD family transcriptional regulator
MAARLGRFIGELQQAANHDELEAVVHGLRSYFHIEHLVYHSIKSSGEQYAVLTYPGAWVARYLEQDYARVDPVVQGCFRRFHPVDWKRLDWSGRNSRAFMAEAQEAGVGNQGYSVPIRGPNGQFALFSVSGHAADGLWAKFTHECVNDVILVAHFINQKALEIECRSDLRAIKNLSPREIDVLTMLAAGLNRAQASESLSISEHTLRSYVEAARVKLGAANTTHAVARAVACGLVQV